MLPRGTHDGDPAKAQGHLGPPCRGASTSDTMAAILHVGFQDQVHVLRYRGQNLWSNTSEYPNDHFRR